MVTKERLHIESDKLHLWYVGSSMVHITMRRTWGRLWGLQCGGSGGPMDLIYTADL